MKRFLWLFFLGISFYATSQQMVLKKGMVTDSIPVANNSTENFAVYLPKAYDPSQEWPVVFVCDMHGQGINALKNYGTSAEQLGYILVSINNLADTLSISQNVMIANKTINGTASLFSIDPARIYATGFAEGARFASILPVFIDKMEGIISCGSDIGNTEVLNAKKPFHYIGIVGKGDFSYPNILQSTKILDKLKFPNQLITFDGRHEWPPADKFRNALEIFTLSSMAKGNIAKDTVFIREEYNRNWYGINAAISAQKLLEAEELLTRATSIFRLLVPVDSLNDKYRWVKKNKVYKTQKRDENTAFNKESFTREDYIYFLEDDVNTYNLENLGWWNYQMGELKKYASSPNRIDRQLGERLNGFINALIEENIDALKKEDPVDEEGLRFLWMLKTITSPMEYPYYLQIISNSAKIEDFGTALFYTEELLKKGYTDKKELYNLKDTALLRITPEFNELVAKYLKEARYDLPIE